MKLRALELEQFRKFDRPVRVAGIADGLNLVVGPNEMGKSTLFAALQAVLFERHRSQGQTVRSLHPAGHEGASPHVALEFEAGGRRYRIEKRFLRRPSAELLLPDGRQLHGEAAEEALELLLAGGDAIGQSGNRRGTPDALGVWNLLWVGQGQSFVQPAVAAGARDTLQAALDSQIGEILAGDQGGALLGELERAWRELVYKTGKPRGRYKEADDARKALDGEVAGLAARQDELERDRDELDRVRADYERLQAAHSDGQEEVQLAELTARRDRLTVQRAEIREAAADLATARHDGARAEAERARRQALRAALVEAEAELAAASAGASATLAAAAAADAAARTQTGEVERLQATLEQAETRARGLQHLAEAIRQRDHGRAALRAAASEVALEIEPAALERVRVDDRPLGAASRTLRIVDPLEIAIAGVGRLRVRPVVPDRRRLQGGLREAERRIARELEVLGLAPPAGKARQLELELRGDAPLAGPAAELGADAADAPCWPEAAAVEAAQGEAEAQISALAAQLRPARRELDLLLDVRHRRSAARDQAAERDAQAERRLGEVRSELAAAERET
ncbi:MAG: hypothetical protein K0R41_2085, partial [Geminicoccaceae bacterium]|nr:hypothetical protein [Geminicoccaceae bacterium]